LPTRNVREPKILEEAGLVQWSGVGIALAIFTELCHPVSWLRWLYHVEELQFIQIRFSSVVQYSIVVSLYA
jgi:hypothetical protein